MPSRATERINFGKIKEIIAPPNLIELQTNSYREFLQAECPPSKRKNLGLQAVFTEVFPIESYDGKCVLDFHSYEIGEPKLDWLECLREGLTFGAPLYVTFLLKEEKGTKEEKVFMGELPLMTPQGTFVINGAERVIVSQLHRSPGSRLRSDPASERQDAAFLPHHSGPRLLVRSAVRHQRPALRLSGPQEAPPEIPDHHVLPRPGFLDAEAKEAKEGQGEESGHR